MTRRIALPKPVTKIYEAVEELSALYPGRPFTPDGHLVGSIGEVIAAESLGLKLYAPSQPGHDAYDEHGDVANQADRRKGHLNVRHVRETCSFENHVPPRSGNRLRWPRRNCLGECWQDGQKWAAPNQSRKAAATCVRGSFMRELIGGLSTLLQVVNARSGSKFFRARCACNAVAQTGRLSELGAAV